MERGGDEESPGMVCGRGRKPSAIAGGMQNAACSAGPGEAGVYLLLALRALAATCGVLVQQVCASVICELPHSSLMWRQQSCSSLFISSPGNAQAMSGADNTSKAIKRQADLRTKTTVIV